MSIPLPEGIHILNVFKASNDQPRYSYFALLFLVGLLIAIGFAKPIFLIPATLVIVLIWYLWQRFRSLRPVSQVIALDDVSHYLVVFKYDTTIFGFRSRQLFFDIHKLTELKLGQIDIYQVLEIYGDGNDVQRVQISNPTVAQEIMQAVTAFQNDHHDQEPDAKMRQQRAMTLLNAGLEKLIL